jgi:aminopeptidase YwaD
MNETTVKPITHVKNLSVKIGHRPAGSPQNQAAAEYIEHHFRNSGLAVERQMFNCTCWETQETFLTVDGVSYEGEANWWSLPCDVTGVIVPIGSIEDLEQTDLTGSIALLYGELTQDKLSPRHSTAYYPEHHQKINQLLDQKKPLAVITVSPLLQAMRHVIKDPMMGIPSATVMPKVGLKLLRNRGKSLRLKMISRRSPGQAWNILGTRAGGRPERIVISAHYDTVWGSPGAYDNASGVSVILTLAQALSDRQLPISFEFYASNGEEFGGQGTLLYLERYGLKEFPLRWDQPVGEMSEIWKPILANINIDGVGLALGTNNVTTIAASKEFSEMIEQIRKRKYPSIAKVDPWPASDHYTFYSHGVPSIAFGCSGGVANHHHQPVDAIEWLRQEKLAEVVQFILDIIDELANKSSDWCRLI